MGGLAQYGPETWLVHDRRSACPTSVAQASPTALSNKIEELKEFVADSDGSGCDTSRRQHNSSSAAAHIGGTSASYQRHPTATNHLHQLRATRCEEKNYNNK